LAQLMYFGVAFLLPRLIQALKKIGLLLQIRAEHGLPSYLYSTIPLCSTDYPF